MPATWHLVRSLDECRSVITYLVDVSHALVVDTGLVPVLSFSRASSRTVAVEDDEMATGDDDNNDDAADEEDAANEEDAAAGFMDVEDPSVAKKRSREVSQAAGVLVANPIDMIKRGALQRVPVLQESQQDEWPIPVEQDDEVLMSGREEVWNLCEDECGSSVDALEAHVNAFDFDKAANTSLPPEFDDDL